MKAKKKKMILKAWESLEIKEEAEATPPAVLRDCGTGS